MKTFPEQKGERAMQLRLIIFTLLLLATAVLSMTSTATYSFADGSDPMPTCRPSPTKQCPPVIP